MRYPKSQQQQKQCGQSQAISIRAVKQAGEIQMKGQRAGSGSRAAVLRPGTAKDHKGCGKQQDDGQKYRYKSILAEASGET